MDFYNTLLAKKLDGGGSSVEVEPLSVTENGTYEEEGKAYSPVNVNVSGGGGVSNPVLTITLVNNLPDPSLPIPVAGIPIGGVKLENGAITGNTIMASYDGGTATGDFLVPRMVTEGTEDYVFETELSSFGGSAEGTNAVNCELMGNFILVTDPSANASITVTITE